MLTHHRQLLFDRARDLQTAPRSAAATALAKFEVKRDSAQAESDARRLAPLGLAAQKEVAFRRRRRLNSRATLEGL
jgi:hypothetical protein